MDLEEKNMNIDAETRLVINWLFEEEEFPYLNKDGEFFLYNIETHKWAKFRENKGYNDETNEIIEFQPYSIIIKNNNLKKKIIFVVSDSKMLKFFFENQIEYIENEILSLKNEFEKLLNTDFKEQKRLFSEKYSQNYDSINIENALKFVLSKFQTYLKFEFEVTDYKIPPEFGNPIILSRFNKLTISYNKPNNLNITMSIFHEYCRSVKDSFESFNDNKPLKGFDLGFSPEGLTKFFEELKKAKIIKNSNNIESFIWAFSPVKIDEKKFKKIEFEKKYYGGIIIKELIDTDNQWQKASRLFGCASAESLKNSYKPKDLLISKSQKDSKALIVDIFNKCNI